MPVLIAPPTEAPPAFARNAVNLASAGLGARIVSVTDDFFAEAARMLSDLPPAFDPDLYDANGKYMDGWESRRRRHGGHDHAVLALAAPGEIQGFDIDTSWFTGNYPPACAVEACRVEGDPGLDTEWTTILKTSALGPGAHHFFPCSAEGVWTHLRLNIYPDGGVARLRVFGRPALDRAALAGRTIDLASALSGGRVLAYSDAHFGAFQRLLSPGRGLNMGDGWETRRRRTPGNDWIIVALGARGVLESVEIDTAHFKGNYPDKVSIQAADLGPGFDALSDAVVTSSMFWDELLAPQPLSADAIHRFETLSALGPLTHARINIFPDGGLSRLRLFGRLAG